MVQWSVNECVTVIWWRCVDSVRAAFCASCRIAAVWTENDKLCKVVSFKLNLFVSKILFHYLCTRKAVAA